MDLGDRRREARLGMPLAVSKAELRKAIHGMSNRHVIALGRVLRSGTGQPFEHEDSYSDLFSDLSVCASELFVTHVIPPRKPSSDGDPGPKTPNVSTLSSPYRL